MDRSEWQGRVGDCWAEEWQRTDRSFSALHRVLLDRICSVAPEAKVVLDVGCGAGQTSIDLARRLPGARILGVDISPALIEIAGSRAEGANCRFVVADAAQWRSADHVPDLIVSRHGVMFFDDPVAAFRTMAGSSSPGARLVFSCFRSPELNDWAVEPLRLLGVPNATEPGSPGPFAFADEARVATLLEQAGWGGIEAEPVDFTYIAGAGDDPVGDALDYFSRIGPAARAMRELDPDKRANFRSEMATLLRNHLADGTVVFQAAAWVWTAKKI